MLSEHQALIKLGKKLGYPLDEKGLCHGTSLRCLEACLSNEQDAFINRINTIAQTDNLAELIHHAQEKVKNHEALTPDALKYLEILAFYDSLILYHYPHEHHKLFHEALTQDNSDQISHLAASDVIQTQGGLSTLYSEPGIYTEHDIKDYLNEIKKIITDNELNLGNNLGFILSNAHHAINLSYQANHQRWILMDINQWPPRITPIDAIDEIAQKIILAFQTHPYTAFNTKLITIMSEKQALQPLATKLNELKKTHLITKEIAQRTTNNINLVRRSQWPYLSH